MRFGKWHLRCGSNFQAEKFQIYFVLQKGLQKKILKLKGNDTFLAGAKGGLVSLLRIQFKDTDEVNKIIDGYFVAFYGDSNDTDDAIPPRYGKYSVSI